MNNNDDINDDISNTYNSNTSNDSNNQLIRDGASLGCLC